VGLVPMGDLSVTVLMVVSTVHIGTLIGPPHDLFPVWFVVLVELPIILQVFPDLDDDVLRLDVFVPLGGAEGETAQRSGDVNDGVLLGVAAF
jgi:hypothetical protein